MQSSSAMVRFGVACMLFGLVASDEQAPTLSLFVPPASLQPAAMPEAQTKPADPASVATSPRAPEAKMPTAPESPVASPSFMPVAPAAPVFMMPAPVNSLESQSGPQMFTGFFAGLSASFALGFVLTAKRIYEGMKSSVVFQGRARDLELGQVPRRAGVPTMMASSAVVDEVMEKLKSMTLLEASELVKAIEETFDVDASAGGGGVMMAPVAAAAGGGDAPAAEEKTEFDLVLESFPADKKIAVLKVVRGITGLGLKEAKEIVEAAPKVLKEGAPKAECEDAIKQITEAGGVAAMK